MIGLSCSNTPLLLAITFIFWRGGNMSNMHTFYQQLREAASLLETGVLTGTGVTTATEHCRREAEETQLQNLVTITQMEPAELAALKSEPGWFPWE
jgi:hypothetical protein